MKNLVILILAFSCMSNHLNGQSISVLMSKNATLINKRKSLDDSIRYLTNLIETVHKIEKDHHHIFKTVTKAPVKVIASQKFGDNFLGSLNAGDSVILYDLQDSRYLIYGNCLIGFIPKESIQETKELKKYNKLVAKEQRSRKQESNELISSEYKSTKSYSGSSYSGTSSKTIHTGPRGGRYYINSNGNKTYVKRKR